IRCSKAALSSNAGAPRSRPSRAAGKNCSIAASMWSSGSGKRGDGKGIATSSTATGPRLERSSSARPTAAADPDEYICRRHVMNELIDRRSFTAMALAGSATLLAAGARAEQPHAREGSGIRGEQKTQVTMLLYPGTTVLDWIGPYEAL